MRLSTNYLLTCIFLLILIISCQKEVKNDIPAVDIPGTVINQSTVQGTLIGKIVDNNDNPVAGAVVKAGNNTTTTDNKGLFRLDNIQLDKYTSLVTVEKTGFFKAYRVFSASPGSTNFVKLKLIQKTQVGTIDASAGGTVSLPDNSRITLPAASVVLKSNGQSYSGSVKIFAAPIDPTAADIGQIIPGSFQANDANNYRVLLKSFGMLAVELEGSSGEQLQIASGKTAKLRFNIPLSLRTSAPATISLWSVDESTGLWKEESKATKSGDYYEGDVSHFSFWNCDINMPTVYLELTVITTEGPLVYTHVKITRQSSGGSSHGYTDSSGHVGGLVPKNESLLLEIFSNCNQPVYSQTIGPFSTNTDLGTVTVVLPAQNTLQIAGTAVDCNNQPVTNGNALIYFDGIYYNKPISNGNFSVTVTRCSNSSASVEVVVIDNAASQQSNTWSGTASGGTVNTGTLSACGTSSASYIDYSVDGTSYSLNTVTPGDSISTNSANSGTSQSALYVSGFRISQPNIRISFYSQANAVGIFPLQYLTVNQFDSITLVTPFNINITAYGAPGQFIEGNFSGQIREMPANTVHNITATFRVRRR